MNQLSRILEDAALRARTYRPEESPGAMAHAGEYATIMATLGTLVKELARTQDLLVEALGLISELALKVEETDDVTLQHIDYEVDQLESALDDLRFDVGV